jgi:hypothetical protein
MFSLPACALLASVLSEHSEGQVVSTFGIVTDVHYADADPGGSRHYRDSLPKMEEATAAITAAKAQFLIELGDFKDTNPQKNATDTLGFLDDIEKAIVKGFQGPHFHVLGNHDVDVLNQTQVSSGAGKRLWPTEPPHTI